MRARIPCVQLAGFAPTPFGSCAAGIGLARPSALNYDRGMESTETESLSSSDGLFPTLLADPEPATLGEPLVQLARLLLKKTSELPDGADLADAKAASLAEIRQLIQNLYLRFAAPEENGIRSRLSEARKRAGLTVPALSKLSGVSVRHIQRIEGDKEKVSPQMVSAVCTVGKLNLVPKALLQVPSEDEIEADRSTFYVAQGFDSLSLHNEMKRLLNGSSGALEQTQVYLDHESSADWIALCNSPEYVAQTRLAFPHREAAQCLARHVGKAGLDLVMLGSGDGQTEVRFTQQVLAETPGSFVCLHLLDASLPLLNKAYGHAMQLLGQEPRVFVSGIQGSFHQLSRYRMLTASFDQPHRTRIYAMFGSTFANLDNEISFLRNSFKSAKKGDVLIFDASHAFTVETQNPMMITQADPALNVPIPDAHRTWLTGPIKRYCRNVEEIKLSYCVDINRPINGSYGLQFVANVNLDNGHTREFSVWNVRRYDINKLSDVIRNLGWIEMGRFPFSSTVRPRTLLMFQRQ